MNESSAQQPQRPQLHESVVITLETLLEHLSESMSFQLHSLLTTNAALFSRSGVEDRENDYSELYQPLLSLLVEDLSTKLFTYAVEQNSPRDVEKRLHEQLAFKLIEFSASPYSCFLARTVVGRVLPVYSLSSSVWQRIIKDGELLAAVCCDTSPFAVVLLIVLNNIRDVLSESNSERFWYHCDNYMINMAKGLPDEDRCQVRRLVQAYLSVRESFPTDTSLHFAVRQLVWLRRKLLTLCGDELAQSQ